MESRRADWKSRAFFIAFFLAIAASIGLTYYHTVVLQDYPVFTDEEEVPGPADFFSYLVSAVGPYFHI
jgi:hypothetical protein